MHGRDDFLSARFIDPWRANEPGQTSNASFPGLPLGAPASLVLQGAIMRQAGKLSNQQDAERLAAYLTTLGIRSRVDGSGSEWALWIFEENELARSRQELDEFLKNPQHPRY